jgi:hypothetical protein
LMPGGGGLLDASVGSLGAGTGMMGLANVSGVVLSPLQVGDLMHDQGIMLCRMVTEVVVCSLLLHRGLRRGSCQRR